LPIDLREVWELNNSREERSHGRAYRSPMWEFLRRAKANPELGRLSEFEAFTVVEACLKLWDNAPDGDLWEAWFPDSDDPRAEFIHTWPRIKWAAATLELALEQANQLPLNPSKSCSPKYAHFVSVVGHLQRRTEGSILVPCRKFAELLDSEPMTISRYRQFAQLSGLLKLEQRGVKLQRKADEFSFAVERFDWKTGKEIVSENLGICVTPDPACYTENQDTERNKEIQDSQEKKKLRKCKERQERIVQQR
jgi:hypothetical protein